MVFSQSKRIFARSFSYSIQFPHLFLACDYLKFLEFVSYRSPQSTRKRQQFHSTSIQRTNIKSKSDRQKQESKPNPISGTETHPKHGLIDQNDEKLSDAMSKKLNKQQQQQLSPNL
ncbi:5278_t:CDS:2, partial [Ambispora leptoticha]